MIHLSLEQDHLVVRADAGDFAACHENQLAYWGFEYDKALQALAFRDHVPSDCAAKLVAYFQRMKLNYSLDSEAGAVLCKQQEAVAELHSALEKGRQFKSAIPDIEETKEFLTFLDSGISRPLKDHQFKAALHLLATQNGANFSVPGSGKTSVVLAVFGRLRELQQVDSLFVVGPPSCFGPWRVEYDAVFGKKPRYEIVAGGDVDTRRSKYLVNRETVRDLYLTTFQTLQRDWERVELLFRRQGVRFFLVVDEAHYIKQIDGAWANAVLAVARQATRRCILTGTPLPRSYTDAFNLFDVLWPESSPISTQDRHRIELYSQRNERGRAAEVLDTAIGSLFYRVRKADLGLAPQVFESPLCIRMNKYERLLYDSVLDRIQAASQTDFARDFDLLVRLRRGRMMRLRQCLSYPVLLGSAVTDYRENLLEDLSLSDVIKHYDELEVPAKLESLLGMVKLLMDNGEKVVIWSNFIGALQLICRHISGHGYGVRLIYGGTPMQNTSVSDELTREEIIHEFVERKSGIDVLVANPAACAESISLHKTCSHAIYYDMSYNCAQYIQSLDRIHRVGGSEEKKSYYHFLQYGDSIDHDILENVERKARNMNAIIDQDYAVYSLDMFAEDEELEAYGRLFGKENHRI